MILPFEYKENEAYHVKWCRKANCEKCKDYIKYIQEHYKNRYDKYLKGSRNWERFKLTI